MNSQFSVQFLVVLLTVITAIGVFEPGLRADDDIAANYLYEHWTSPATVQFNNAVNEMHLIDPQTGKTSLLIVDWTDELSNFSWSPDRSRILFLKYTPQTNRSAIWFVTVKTKVQTLVYTLPSEDGYLDAKWSPDGKQVGICAVGPVDPPVGWNSSAVVVVDTNGNLINKFDDMGFFAWSPDQSKMFLTTSENANSSSAIIDIKTGKATWLNKVIHDPFWIDNEHVIGFRGYTTATGEGAKFMIVGCSKNAVTYRTLQYTSDQGKPDATAYEIDEDALGYEPYILPTYWFRIPHHDNEIALEGLEHVSDGPYPSSLILNLRNGHIHTIGDYDLYGFSSDGNSCLISQHEWTGEYKSGGDRVGPLMIMNIRTKKIRRLTYPVASVFGAAW